MQYYRRVLSFGVPMDAFTRDIWLICLSNVIGAFGEGLYFWVFPLYIQELQADYVQLGLVLSILYLASALVPLPGGLLADRFDRKKILILAWVPWVLAPLIYSFANSWPQLIPGTICWGVSMIGVPAANAYIITALKNKRRIASVLSFVWASYSFSYIFAPAIGGYLTTLVGERTVFRLACVLTAIATGIFHLLHSQHPHRNAAEGKQQLPESNGKLWRKLALWSVFFALISFFTAVSRSFTQTFLNNEVGLNTVYVGLFGSANFAGLTFIGIAIGRLGDRWKKSQAIGLCLLFYAVSCMNLILAREPLVLMFTALLFGGSAVTGTLVGSFVGSIAPENKRGLWPSIPQTLGLLATSAAPYMAGYLYSFRPDSVFILSAIAMPILALLMMKILKD